MNEIDILEIKDLLTQQAREFSAGLDAVKRLLPEPPPLWRAIALEIAAAGLTVGLSFVVGVMFYRYALHIPCN